MALLTRETVKNKRMRVRYLGLGSYPYAQKGENARKMDGSERPESAYANGRGENQVSVSLRAMKRLQLSGKMLTRETKIKF